MDNKEEVPTTKPYRLANSETGPEVEEILCPETLKQIREYVIGSWPIKRTDSRFPGPQPVSMEKRDLNKLKKWDYICCEKTDGMRFMLVCLNIKNDNNNNNEKYTVLIDRAFRIFNVKLNFGDCMYKGTILDGELVFDNELSQWKYLIHDCITFEGVSYGNMDFNIRYQQVGIILSQHWIHDSAQSSFWVYSKYFFPFKEFEKLQDHMDKITHNTDGIIFTPVKLPVGTGTQYSLFKWKSQEHHTFDFIIKFNEENHKIEGYVYNKGENVLFCSINIETENGKTLKENIEKLENFEWNKVIEFRWDVSTENFWPLKVRVDKTHPNSMKTVQKTFLNIKENITINDLNKLSKTYQ